VNKTEVYDVDEVELFCEELKNKLEEAEALLEESETDNEALGIIQDVIWDLSKV